MYWQIKYTLQCCIFILMATDTSWAIMYLYIEPEAFKIGSLSISLTFNTLARILSHRKCVGYGGKTHPTALSSSN